MTTPWRPVRARATRTATVELCPRFWLALSLVHGADPDQRAEADEPEPAHHVDDAEQTVPNPLADECEREREAAVPDERAAADAGQEHDGTRGGLRGRVRR